MLKKILLTTALLTNVSAYCWDPYIAPAGDDEIYYISAGYILTQCPCCLEDRLFPSEEFFLNRRLKLTAQEEQQMIQAISTYDGEKIKGAICPFCGRAITSDDEF